MHPIQPHWEAEGKKTIPHVVSTPNSNQDLLLLEISQTLLPHVVALQQMPPKKAEPGFGCSCVGIPNLKGACVHVCETRGWTCWQHIVVFFVVCCFFLKPGASMCSDDGGRLSCSSLNESPASQAGSRNPRRAPDRWLGCRRRPSLWWMCRGFLHVEPRDGSYTPGWSTDSKGWTASLRTGSTGGRGKRRQIERRKYWKHRSKETWTSKMKKIWGKMNDCLAHL